VALCCFLAFGGGYLANKWKILEGKMAGKHKATFVHMHVNLSVTCLKSENGLTSFWFFFFFLFLLTMKFDLACYYKHMKMTWTLSCFHFNPYPLFICR